MTNDQIKELLQCILIGWAVIGIVYGIPVYLFGPVAFFIVSVLILGTAIALMIGFGIRHLMGLDQLT